MRKRKENDWRAATWDGWRARLPTSRGRYVVRPVDSGGRRAQLGGVKKKPAKVGESPVPYAAKPATRAAESVSSGADGKPVRYLDAKIARKLTEEIFDKHHELFRKLAQ